MSIVVLCAGGHARVLIEVLRSRGIRVDALTDRQPTKKGMLMSKVPIIGPDDAVLAMSCDEISLVNGLGNRASRVNSGLAARKELFERFRALGYRFPVITHASSIVASDAELCDGAQILAGAVVQPAVVVGRNVIVNTGAIVEHDCRIGDHTHIAPGAVLCGGVAIGAEAHVGAGATVLSGVTIGDGAVLAAGAVVAGDVVAGGFAGVEFPR